MVWLCFIVPWVHTYYGCRFWPLEWRGIAWADLDVIWVAEQGPMALYGGSMGAGFVCCAVLETTLGWTLPTEGMV